MVFDHWFVSKVCVNNHHLMVKIHPLLFNNPHKSETVSQIDLFQFSPYYDITSPAHNRWHQTFYILNQTPSFYTRLLLKRVSVQRWISTKCTAQRWVNTNCSWSNFISRPCKYRTFYFVNDFKSPFWMCLLARYKANVAKVSILSDCILRDQSYDVITRKHSTSVEFINAHLLCTFIMHNTVR